MQEAQPEPGRGYRHEKVKDQCRSAAALLREFVRCEELTLSSGRDALAAPTPRTQPSPRRAGLAQDQRGTGGGPAASRPGRSAMSEHHHPEHSGEAITILKVKPILDTGIVLTSASQEVSGKLADRHSAYHDNISPPLN